MRSVVVAFGCLVIGNVASPASALCSGASVQREYREADLVVKARLIAETDTWSDAPSAAYRHRWGPGDLVTSYELRPSRTFKGRQLSRIRFFETHDSGASYLDADKDYLLFLNYYPPSSDLPNEAHGAVYVRHACGQSKLWKDLRPRDLGELNKLAGRSTVPKR